MRAPPSFFGYQIFAALVSPSSACNLEDMMTLPLHYRLASSGDFFLLGSRLLFAIEPIHGLLTMSSPWQTEFDDYFFCFTYLSIC
ncbi:hypothetical protein DEU56DRAFT_453326 [Suillus clintonianus]|uniref:uncharacterized protein n=1 Tax=Suillus clintonianus TaxID=1904413 RepID=UPI001B867C25|nr:uncharacterized protein DEU56DRAFT_453326 [Suillus clintonianus]KAG2131646.1 hypothetical protein DEU56DRAFT_453326 [Suillus clintonianus]